MGLIDLERNSTDERVSVIARLRALGVDLSKELLHAAQVAESVATLELAEPRARPSTRYGLRYFTRVPRFRSS